MAFTCAPCHTEPQHIMHFRSFGPCENCGQQAECSDCRCPTKTAVKPDVQPEPVKHRIDRSALRGGKTAEQNRLTREALARGETVRIEAPNWVRCALCGKTGSHTHIPAGRKTPDCWYCNGSYRAAGDRTTCPVCDGAAEPTNVRVFSSEEENDEPGCNDCDGFVYVGESCQSCGLKGSIRRDPMYPWKVLGGEALALMDDPCPECGGDHDRIDRRDGSCPALDEHGNRRETTLDTVIREVVASRREALKHMSADDVRAFFEGNLTVAIDTETEGGVLVLNRRTPRIDALVDHLHPDPEHEPGNPNCLCFQRSCR